MDWIRFLMLTSADNSTTVIAVRGTLESCFGEVFGYVDVAMILGWFLDLFLLQCRCEGIGPHVQGCKDQTGAIWRHWHGKVLTHFPWDLLLGNDTTTSTKSSYIRTCRYIYIYIFACLYTKYIIYNMIIIYIYIPTTSTSVCPLWIMFYMSSSHIHYLPLPMGFGWGLPGCTSRCRIVVCASADASLKLRRPRCLLGGLGASNLRRGLEVSPKWRMDDCRS